MNDLNKINRNNENLSINQNGNTSIKQSANVSGFEDFQRKVAGKLLCRRAIGAITGVVGAAGAAVGGIFAIKVGVAAMVGALAGLVGATVTPFVLIGMGALCIAAIIGGIVFFVKNSKENIYIKELNKLLQSDGVEDKIENKKQAISYLNEMISKHKEGSVEYNAAVRFLNENTEIFKLCLESKDRKLFDGITKFLTEVSKNKCEETKYSVKEIIVDCLNSDSTELNTCAATLLTTFLKNNNTKSLSCEIVKLKCFSETIQRFLKSKNNGLKINTIDLLTEMLKNEDIKSIAEGIIKGHIKSDNTRSMDNAIKLLTALSKDKSVQTTVVQIVKNCLGQGNQELRGSAIRLLTNALKIKNTDIETFVKEFFSEKNIDLDDENEVFSEKIEGWLVSNDDQLKANTIALLTEMFKSENTDLANIAKKIITTGTDEGFVIESQSFSDIIKGRLKSRDDGLKIKTVELLNEMLVDSDEELKNKSREILKSDVLNTKGMLNIFLKNEGNVNEEAISLLKPMCGDEDMKNILSNLIGKDLVEKLEKQGNEVKSDDVVNVLYENVVKGIFSNENKENIIDILKNEDGLHNIDIIFDENGQITAIEKTKLNSFFKDGKLNLKALKDQSTLDFGRSLKSITVNGKVAKVDRSNAADNGKILENAFKNAEIDEETKKLIYKFPGQSTISTSFFLSLLDSVHLGDDYMLTLSFRPGDPKSDSYNMTVNSSNGSVEVQARYISHVILYRKEKIIYQWRLKRYIH